MSISIVTGFRICDICNYVIQESRFYWYKDLHFHPQRKCTMKITIPKVRNGMERKWVKTHKHNFPKIKKGN